jgi:hypothetical protein
VAMARRKCMENTGRRSTINKYFHACTKNLLYL